MIPALPDDGQGAIVTVGTFDGVHHGHRKVLDEIAQRAKRTGRRSVLVTFQPHPLEIVNPKAAPALLTTADERREILAQSELDVVIFVEFTTELSHLEPEQFIQILVDRLDMRELVIGHDHGFGRRRSGDVDLLRRLGAELGFAVDVVEGVTLHGHQISSTLVRRAVAGGDLDTAKELLGRQYSLSSIVIRGAGRGRGIGYPTLNVAVEDERKLLPPDGVYAVHVEWRAGSSGGMMHQGARPTFDETERSIEAHVFELDDDLYGERVKLSWVSRLRDVQRFDSPEALKRQLDKDFAAAQVALTGVAGSTSH
jgi:riboflavin kinase / FMN adenylyltransferase